MEIPIRFPDVHRKVQTAMDAGDLALAEGELQKSIAKAPEDVALLVLQADVWTALGRENEVPDLFREVIRLLPGTVVGHLHFATWLDRQRRAPEAIALLESLEPPETEREIYKSVLYKLLAENDRFGEIEPELLRLVGEAETPSVRSALATLLVRIYSGMGDQQAALRVAAQAYETAQDRVSAGRLNLICALYSDELSPTEITSLHVGYGEGIESAVGLLSPEFPNNRNHERKLRMGWVSADFNSHVVADFLLGTLQAWDADDLEVHLYAHGPRDETTAAFREVSRFHDVRDLSPGDLARKIRSDKIDVLVDLMGHTAGSLLPIFAMRPAPVQITYLGYPATTGFRRIQARFVDLVTDPPGSEEQSTERLLRIEGGFLGYQPVRPHPDSVSPPDEVPTFGCFNNPTKVSGASVRLFAQCLKSVPESRLLLKSSLRLSSELQNRAEKRFHTLFEEQGIDFSRIEFLPYTNSELDAFRQFGRAHVALDPTPYNGTTCTCQLLQHGIPVVALLGRDHRSRVSASILHHSGFQDWIAKDELEYANLAMRLMNQREQWVADRPVVSRQFRESSVCDPQRVANAISEAIRELWQDWCADPS